jgi:SMI1 / KNR4 family (SUKH-1)
MTKVLQLKNKLIQLALLDTTFEIFGSDSHQYQLNPCLQEEEIEEFEAKYNIKLPSDYRDFLLEVANGGAGPGYGLYALPIIDYQGYIPGGKTETLHQEKNDSLCQPFPLKEAWNDLNLITKNEAGSASDRIAYFDNKYIQGTLTIANYGCGIYAILVITGEQRGNVWIDDRTNDGGIYPASVNFCHDFHDDDLEDLQPDEAQEQPVSFYDWYDDWLNRSLRQVS